MPNKCGNHALFRRFGCVRIDIHSIVTAIEKSPKHQSCRHGNRKNAKTSILSSRQLKKAQNINPVVTTHQCVFHRHNYPPFSDDRMDVKTHKNRVSALRPKQADSLKPFDTKDTEKGALFIKKGTSFSIVL